MAKSMRSVHKTWADLSNSEVFYKFFNGFLELLQNKLFKREVISNNYSYSYYTCGQLHDPRNPKWKPFQHLEQYCERTRFDFLTVKDIIEDRIGRKFKCECQLLRDDRAKRRFELELITPPPNNVPANKALQNLEQNLKRGSTFSTWVKRKPYAFVLKIMHSYA